MRAHDRRTGLEWLNERPNEPSTQPTPASSERQDDAPTGLNGEHNSLYAINKVLMEVERWWSDSVHCSVFLCLQYRWEHRIVERDLSYWTNERPTKYTTDSRNSEAGAVFIIFIFIIIIIIFIFIIFYNNYFIIKQLSYNQNRTKIDRSRKSKQS